MVTVAVINHAPDNMGTSSCHRVYYFPRSSGPFAIAIILVLDDGGIDDRTAIALRRNPLGLLPIAPTHL
jgi:hypothetical protein